jgi:uncharacterized protein (TIGR03083 family)
MDVTDAYAEVQDRFVTAVTADGVDDQTPVPACPGWSVHDVLAHHVGVVSGLGSGDLLGFTRFPDLLEQWRDPEVAAQRDAMTARQVQLRRGRPVDELVEEWRSAVDVVFPMMRGETPFPVNTAAFASAVLINDVVVHEGDVRAALGLPRAPDSVALSMALRGYAFSLGLRIASVGLAPLVLAYAGKELALGGDGTRGARVTADRHDLVRAMAGRRTEEQIRSLSWDGDPTPYLPVLSEYGQVVAPGQD